MCLLILERRLDESEISHELVPVLHLLVKRKEKGAMGLQVIFQGFYLFIIRFEGLMC